MLLVVYALCALVLPSAHDGSIHVPGRLLLGPGCNRFKAGEVSDRGKGLATI